MLLLLLWVLAVPGFGSAQSLSGEIRTLLERPAAQRAFWGIRVVDLETEQVVYEHNPQKLFIPASNAKLFSTALGLVRLGTDYKFTTAVVSKGAISPEAGLLSGDLVLRGGGDPNLSSRVVPYHPDRTFGSAPLAPITKLATALAEAGLRQVEGDIVGDDSRHVWQRHAAGWSADDPMWGYGAPVSALSFNDNLIALLVLPGGAAGRAARASFRPDIGYYSLKNRTRTTSTRTVSRRLSVGREPGSRTVELWGEISIRSRGRKMELAVDDPALFAAWALRRELEKLGVTITGEVRAQHRWPHEVLSLKQGRPASEEGPAPLASLESAPLADILTVVNKESQNLHAEILLREVGYVRRGVGSFEAGLEELKAFLIEAGLKPWDFKFKDASGLSRQNLVSPAGTVQLLKYLWNSPSREAFLRSLPLAGEDGTLDWRFSRTPARRRIRAKTGSLSNVTALSGYAETAGGRQLAFSILVNNYGVPSSYIRKLVDEIAALMVTASDLPEPVSNSATEPAEEVPAVGVP